VGSVVAVGGCSSDAVQLPRPARGTIGEETFGVFCDRVGAQSLREDLSGGSYRAVCHRDPTTRAYAATVDRASLPPMPADASPLARAARDRGIARVEALGRHRSDLIAALDAVVPADGTVIARDGAGDGCAPGRSQPLPGEVANLLARMTDAYDDGTVPQATRSIARLMQAIQASPDAQAALERLGQRAGYRPEEVALGLARPVLAYPGLRDLTNATLGLLAPQGAAHPAMLALATTASLELADKTVDPYRPPLGTTADPRLGIERLSRPRTTLELLSHVMSAEDPAFGGGASRYVVRRDVRGMASVVDVGDAIPFPFVDADRDGLADVDGSGRFVTVDGSAAPAPFPAPSLAMDSTPRDPSGRALDAPAGRLIYGYIDASHTYAASTVKNVRAMVDPDPSAEHETLMDALAGAYVVAGPRLGSPAAVKTYPDGSTTSYDAFVTAQSPLVGLVYAAGQTLADPSTDAALAAGAWLFQSDEADLARATDAALRVKRTSDAHPEATLPARSTLWDDLLDVLGRIAAVTDDAGHPILLEEMLLGLADPATKDLPAILGLLVSDHDEVDYDRRDVDGPPIDLASGVVGGAPGAAVDRSRPDAGYDRSLLQRFIQLIHDTRGVSVCNRPGAQVKAIMDIPVVGGTVNVSIPDSPLVTAFWGKSSFGECEVFKIDDMASFYMQAIVGQGEYVLRDKQLRDGVQINLGFTTLSASATATTVHLLEQSSGLTGYQPPGTTDPAARTGFWTPGSSKQLMTRPEWLNRNLFLPNGYAGPNGDVPKPALADSFSRALNPDHAGTAVCPKRTVADPLPPGDPNYTPGGKIMLPACADGDWLDQRDAHTIFALETTGFYPAIAPLVRPFVARGHPELLLELLDVLHAHWADGHGAPSECRLSPTATCTQDGVVRYEPILADAFAGDLLPALQSTVRALSSGPTYDVPCAGAACADEQVSGVRALAYAVRAATDPGVAAARGLVDRHGNKTAARSDGTTKAQVTPIDLWTAALSGFDRAFADFAAAHPDDAQRLTQWRRARSQLVDQFLSVDLQPPRFHDAALPRFVPIAIGALRQQLWAKCVEWPRKSCGWAGSELARTAADGIGSPLFANGLDVAEAIRKDTAARVELEKLLSYLLADTSGGEALATLLASTADGIQLLQDQPNLVPISGAIAAALRPNKAGELGLVDAQLALLTRLTGRSFDPAGVEQCGRELDPNQVLTPLLAAAVTPVRLDGVRTMTPIEVVMDAVADVSRASPDESGPLEAIDYGSVADETAQFLLDDQRGLEQFYAVVRNATE
jgi:hypothetical protein